LVNHRHFPRKQLVASYEHRNVIVAFMDDQHDRHYLST
jgi:hypothetical protein